MLSVIHALDKLDALNVRLAHYDAHTEFLAGPNPYSVRIVTSGPLTADDGTTMFGSLFPVEALDRANPSHDASIWERVTIAGFQRRQG